MVICLEQNADITVSGTSVAITTPSSRCHQNTEWFAGLSKLFLKRSHSYLTLPLGVSSLIRSTQHYGYNRCNPVCIPDVIKLTKTSKLLQTVTSLTVLCYIARRATCCPNNVIAHLWCRSTFLENDVVLPPLLGTLDGLDHYVYNNNNNNNNNTTFV